MYTSYRNYFTIDGRKMTQWFNLTMGEYYYIDVRHVNYQLGEHVSVAVEISDPNAVPQHFHTMRQIQRLMVNQKNVRDTTNVTI